MPLDAHQLGWSDYPDLPWAMALAERLSILLSHLFPTCELKTHIVPDEQASLCIARPVSGVNDPK